MRVENTEDLFCPILFVTLEEREGRYKSGLAKECYLLSDESAVAFPRFEHWDAYINGCIERPVKVAHPGVAVPRFSEGCIPHDKFINPDSEVMIMRLESIVALAVFDDARTEEFPIMVGPALEEGVSVLQVKIRMLLPDVSQVPDIRAVIQQFDRPVRTFNRTPLSWPTKEERDERDFVQTMQAYSENSKQLRFSAGMILPMKVMLGDAPITCAVRLGDEILSLDSGGCQSFRATIYAYGALASIPPNTILRRELTIELRGSTYHFGTDMCVVV